MVTIVVDPFLTVSIEDVVNDVVVFTPTLVKLEQLVVSPLIPPEDPGFSFHGHGLRFLPRITRKLRVAFRLEVGKVWVIVPVAIFPIPMGLKEKWEREENWKIQES